MFRRVKVGLLTTCHTISCHSTHRSDITTRQKWPVVLIGLQLCDSPAGGAAMTSLSSPAAPPSGGHASSSDAAGQGQRSSSWTGSAGPPPPERSFNMTHRVTGYNVIISVCLWMNWRILWVFMIHGKEKIFLTDLRDITGYKIKSNLIGFISITTQMWPNCVSHRSWRETAEVLLR